MISRILSFLAGRGRAARAASTGPEGARVASADGNLCVTVRGALAVTVERREPPLRREGRLAFDGGLGVGDVQLTLSPSGRLCAALLSSGQSETGYALFSVPDLETLATLPYQGGDSICPSAFSPDETYLATVIEPGGPWWAGDDDAADWDTPARGGPVRWATLHVQETRRGGARTEHPILVDVPGGWVAPEALAGATWPRNLRFDASGGLVLDAPWGGECRLEVPPAGPCFAPPPPVP